MRPKGIDSDAKQKGETAKQIKMSPGGFRMD